MLKKILIAILSILLIQFFFYIVSTTKITVIFEEFEPFKHALPVYYNGFKLGHTTKIYPSKNYKSTMVNLRIKLLLLKLPINTYGILRRKDKKDYIELEYPKEPFLATLGHNDIIKGHVGVNFENYLQNQAQNGGLDEIKQNVNNTIISTGETFNALTEMIHVMTDILKDAQPKIQDSINNVNLTTKNLADSSFEIKNTIEKGYVDKTLYNFQESSANFVLTTKNINGFSGNLNQEGKRLTNCLLYNLNITVKNANEIIVGIGNTLKKKLGGLRLVFSGIDSCFQK